MYKLSQMFLTNSCRGLFPEKQMIEMISDAYHDAIDCIYFIIFFLMWV